MDVRSTLYDMYAQKKQVTIHMLKEELHQKEILHISYGSLRTLLFNLGFKYLKDDNRRALMETTNISSMRAAFFRKYMENKNSPFARQLVFLDETWIFSKGSKMRSWQDNSVKSVRKPGGFDGKRFIVLHAGHSGGFIKNASLIFASKSKTLDYHGEMNHELFTKWVENQLIPNLEEPSLIIMDNAPYHSVQLEKQPSSSWKKQEIAEWLVKNNIPYNRQMFKPELLSIAKMYKRPKQYKIDTILQENGHEVLRLPPYHCQFNAIEMIWADAKNFYNTHIGENGHKDENVLDMWKKSLEKCTPEVWNAKVCHTEKIIKDWYDDLPGHY
ncbi:uncharacterized protein LOC126750614 [Anthonomus grandis grandis]|uniref:uncharacterized protein LOC126750614 n=1 Tax=Anthonomus grandis grandis TaxID=2921223 RepID=UPI002165C8B1|nr:uncharacterized protein LOC126750614 [Anthonomus grandis grandis]